MLLHEIRDPRIGFVTLTSIKLSDDLRNAKVFVSVLGENKKDTALEGLNSASNYIRKEIGKRIRIRYTPELVFKIDESIEQSMRINRILEELKEDG